MAVAIEARKRVTTGLKSWLDDVAAYEREFKKWEGRVERILKRYRDDARLAGDNDSARFNILWSNVQTLVAATYSRIPKPDVSRRFRDNDPVGRVASLILERGLDYHVQHYSSYRNTLKADVYDRFLGGRGTAWVRYEPHFKTGQVTDDVESEELDYECAEVDYVHWRDFGHSVARTWEEVGRVWRKVYMTKEALIERFGEEKAKLIPMDANPLKDTQRDVQPTDAVDRACIYEGWDKNEKKAVWFSKSVKDILDERPDPLKLEDFFPCPRPIFSTLTNDSLVPVPDFTLYQDQARELDILADRKDGLIKALQVKGVYDGSLGVEIARIFTEGQNNTLIPVKNWAAFAEKNGLSGALDLVDILPIAQALEHCYKAEQSTKNDIYEITGISDIVRGQTEASETATAQQIKGQYASLRLKTYQEEVARFATDLLQIMAQVMCGKFNPQTLLQISAADQLSDEDKQHIPQAMELLVGSERMMDPEADGKNPLRSFRVEVAADTLVYLDEQAEKEARVEFLTATGTFIEKMGQVIGMTPPEAKGPVTGLLMEMLKFGVTGFRVGKTIEGAFDETAEKLKQLAMQPVTPQEPPEVQVERMKGEIERERMLGEQGLERERFAGEQQLQREKIAGEQELERERMDREFNMRAQEGERTFELEQRKASDKGEIERERIAASQKPTAEVKIDGKAELASMAEMIGGAAQSLAASQERIEQMLEAFANASQNLAVIIEKMGSPKRTKVIRGPDGRVAELVN